MLRVGQVEDVLPLEQRLVLGSSYTRLSMGHRLFRHQLGLHPGDGVAAARHRGCGILKLFGQAHQRNGQGFATIVNFGSPPINLEYRCSPMEVLT
jgi:hypothetical protein